MSDVTPGAAPESAPAPVPAPTGEVSEAEALSFLAKRREAPKAPISGEEAPPAAADRHTESGTEPDAAPPEEPSGENEGEIDPAGEPPIDPPRSWTKADRELFASLPRDTQERLLELDRTRELEIRRGQNEVAEKTKAADAERQAAEQARQQYEAALPNLVNSALAEHQSYFPDIQTQEDVLRLSREDKGRYLEWMASAQRVQAVQAEAQQAQQRQYEDAVKSFAEFAKKEANLFLAKAPEYADPEKAPKAQAQARETLEAIGFKPDEIEAAWNGQITISLRDHRAQLLIRDAARYRAAQARVSQKPVPNPTPVQKPGPASSKGEQRASEVQAALQRLEKSGSDKDALAVLKARRRAS
jgi:hypothetical protein